MTQQVDRAGRRTTVGLALILSVQLMLILDMTVVNVALPDIRTDLGFTPSALSWVLNAYTLTFGGLLLLGGRLGDVFGRRRTFVAGLCRLHPRLAARRPGPHSRAAGRGAFAAGRRRRRRRPERAGAPDHHRTGRGCAQPGARPLQRGELRRRLDRPDPRRRPHRLRVVALVAVHQRAARAARAGARAPIRRRDPAPARPLRRGRRRHGDPRLGQPRLRLHQRARPRLDLRRHGRRVRARRRCCSPVRRQRASRRVPAARAGPAAQPDARRARSR